MDTEQKHQNTDTSAKTKTTVWDEIKSHSEFSQEYPDDPRLRVALAEASDRMAARIKWRENIWIVMALQLICMNLLIFGLAINHLTLEPSVVKFFITGVFVEVIGLVYIMVEHDFPRAK